MFSYNQAKVLISSKSTFWRAFLLHHICLPITLHHSTKFQKKQKQKKEKEKKGLKLIPRYKVAKFWSQIGPFATNKDIPLKSAYLPINPHRATKFPKNLYSGFRDVMLKFCSPRSGQKCTFFS